MLVIKIIAGIFIVSHVKSKIGIVSALLLVWAIG